MEDQKTFKKWQQDNEISTRSFPDIDLIGFVRRGQLIVLQTSQETFELMSKTEKLNSIGYMLKSLEALKDMVGKEN